MIADGKPWTVEGTIAVLAAMQAAMAARGWPADDRRGYLGQLLGQAEGQLGDDVGALQAACDRLALLVDPADPDSLARHAYAAKMLASFDESGRQAAAAIERAGNGPAS